MSGSDRRRGRLPRWLQRILGVPLTWKLAGANALIVIATLVTATAMHSSSAADREMLAIIAAAMAGTFAVNLALVLVALRPLRALESTAARVREGDLEARVVASPLADRGIRRVGVALNDLLDALVADRARVRRLAAEVIRAGDHERARLARELHDSTAQTLSALVMQLAAIGGQIEDPELATRLEAVRAAGLDALEEVRLLSQTVHPRVLDDLGLPAALRHLGREMERRAGILIDVDASTTAALPAQTESTLYRIAQEGIANALRHGAPTEVHVRLVVDDWNAAVEVTDNGAGFDAATAANNGDGLGIFSMRERVALVDGSFELVSRPGAGTRIRATVPLRSAPSPRGP
jgi:signal transduction histidine kinase